jgi:hypothetical protein
MAAENRMTSAESPQGRRIIVAVVTGEAGDLIQAWRLRHDPVEAERLPPHTTLCYWAPTVDPEAIEKQLRHAFLQPIAVNVGPVKEFDNDQHTFYVEVSNTDALDEARRRFYDGKFLELPILTSWTWHITCVRDSRDRDLDYMRTAAGELVLPREWLVDTVSYLELRGKRYEQLACWRL